jgi:hypothetical protein
MIERLIIVLFIASLAISAGLLRRRLTERPT